MEVKMTKIVTIGISLALVSIAWLILFHTAQHPEDNNVIKDKVLTPAIFSDYNILFPKSAIVSTDDEEEINALQNTILINKATGTTSDMFSIYASGGLFTSAVIYESQLYVIINNSGHSVSDVGSELWVYDDKSKIARIIYTREFIWGTSVSLAGRIALFQQDFCRSQMALCGDVKVVIFNSHGSILKTIDLGSANFCLGGGEANINAAGWKGDDLIIACVGGYNDYSYGDLNTDTFSWIPNASDSRL
jgi:hypothetical protein